MAGFPHSHEHLATDKASLEQSKKGILDDIHLTQLISDDDHLRGRISVVSSPERLGPDTEAGSALAAVAAGRQSAHGFILGCAIHWVGCVVRKASASKAHGSEQIWLCDSYNRPMARLLALGSVRALAEQHELGWREKSRQSLSAHPEWQHQPEWSIEKALEEGVPEWWKGTRKAPLFWKWKSREVRLALAIQELEHMREYLEILVAALVPKQAL